MTATRNLTPGYRLNSEKVSRDLYRLAAALLSFDRMQEPGTRLGDLCEKCADDEIAHLLVGTALANRLQLEHMKQLRDDPTELSFSPVEGHCGIWGWGEEFKKSTPLEFREACNKIIHAETVSVTSIKGLSLCLEGKKGKDEWQVAVDILAYIEISLKNFENAVG